MRVRFVVVSVLTGALFALGAAQALAERDEETKSELEFELFPCGLVGDDATGEAKYESESREEGLLEVKIEGATRFSGVTLEVVTGDGQRLGPLIPDESGDAHGTFGLSTVGPLDLDANGDPVFTSDPERCP